MQRTAHLLRQFLLDDPAYRQQWERHSHRCPRGEISHAGVANVLALYLWDTGRHDELDAGLPRRLRDRVRRALSGAVLTAETLTWLIEAFAMYPEDREKLWSVFTQGQPSPRRGLSHTLIEARPLLLPQRHRTVAVFERRQIGPDRRPTEHYVMHVISAMADDVSNYAYVFNPVGTNLKMVRGGSITRIQSFGGGLAVANVVLDHALRTHDTTTLEYFLTFTSASTMPDEVRRFSHGRTENVDIAVRFAPAAIPRSVQQVAWDSYEGEDVILSEAVGLDENHQAHVFWPYLEEAVAGLRWQW